MTNQRDRMAAQANQTSNVVDGNSERGSKHLLICSVLILASTMNGCALAQHKSEPDEFDDLAAETSADATAIEEGLDFDTEPAGQASASGGSHSDQLNPALASEELSGRAPAMSSNGVMSVTDLRYVSRKGGGTVVIETTEPATFRTREVPNQNQVVIDIANAQLPDRLKRPYITREFGQAIASVNAYQEPGSSTARVIVQFKTPMRAAVTQSGRRLLVLATGPAPAAAGQKLAGGKEAGSHSSDLSDLDELSSIARTASSEAGGETQIFPGSASGLGVEPTKFYGKPISIQVSQAKVQDVIGLIAEQSGANLVLAADIEGDLSLKLKDIPWDQALMIVMKARNLGYVRQGSVLRIAPIEMLQQEAEAAKKILDAQKAAEPLKVKIIPVSYAEVKDLVLRVTPFLTPGRGQVTADDRTSSLILTDVPEILERVQNLVKALDTPPLQVLIEGKIIEATETFRKEFGTKWGFNGKTIALGGNLALNKNNLTIDPGTSSGYLNYAFNLGTLDVFGDLDAALSLAEKEDHARIVSSPRIVTMNNKEANISQTTGIYILQPSPTVSTNGQSVPQYTRQEVPLTLKVKPQVTNDGDVILEVNLTRSFVGSRVATAAPDINQRSAQTNVMVRSGETAVIGGIYQSDTSESETGVPWLRNIPVLGWLFKQKAITAEKNELLLFLTPRVLNSEKSPVKEETL